jgi:hypothetical protein
VTTPTRSAARTRASLGHASPGLFNRWRSLWLLHGPWITRLTCGLLRAGRRRGTWCGTRRRAGRSGRCCINGRLGRFLCNGCARQRRAACNGRLGRSGQRGGRRWRAWTGPRRRHGCWRRRGCRRTRDYDWLGRGTRLGRGGYRHIHGVRRRGGRVVCGRRRARSRMNGDRAGAQCQEQEAGYASQDDAVSHA